MQQRLHLGQLRSRVERRLRAWQEAGFGERLLRKDATLWAQDPLPELADRLGWLDLPEAMSERVGDLEGFATTVRLDGYQHAVLLGMGGSSLAPDVFQRTFGHGEGYPELIVLDSTHPHAVLGILDRIDPARTLFIVSSKSGTTTETLSFFKFFWQRVSEVGADPGKQFVAITDPGTGLESLGTERGFRRIFAAPSDVGGRYSALSVFGLVPAAIIGVDVAALIGNALGFRNGFEDAPGADANPALVLGAAMGELAAAGLDKLTITTSPSLMAFPDWVEQLVAESTGKDDTGIVPIVGESLQAPATYGADRFFVHVSLAGDNGDAATAALDNLANAGHPVCRIDVDSTSQLGSEFLRWEIAVAAAGAALGIHPFNQPDVQLAKDLAKKAMAGGTDTGGEGDPVRLETVDANAARTTIDRWLSEPHVGDYVAVHAYLAPSVDTTEALNRLRAYLGERTGLATTVGYGPRFLHSTGQLHKGGPNTGMFLQIVDEPTESVGVPETDFTFNDLIRAQAIGDAHALLGRGRRVLRVNLGDRRMPDVW